MRRLAFQGCEKVQVKACRNAVGSLTIPTIPCSLLDHKTCMHVGFKKLNCAVAYISAVWPIYEVKCQNVGMREG